MNVNFKLLLSVLLIFVSSYSYAEVSEESLNELLDLSGIAKQAEQIPGLIKAGMQQDKQQGAPIPDEDFNAMLMTVDRSVIPSEIVAEVRVSLKESLSEDEAKQLLTWYRSDSGREVTQAEEHAATPEAYQEMMQSAQSLMQDLERLEYAMRLDLVLGMTNISMDLQEQTGIAVYSAIMTVLHPDKPLDLAPLKTKMRAEHAQTREAVKQIVLLSLIYSYKDLKIDRIKEYEAFLKDPVAKKFTKTASKSMSRAVVSSMTKFANSLAVTLKDKRQKKLEQ